MSLWDHAEVFRRPSRVISAVFTVHCDRPLWISVKRISKVDPSVVLPRQVLPTAIFLPGFASKLMSFINRRSGL